MTKDFNRTNFPANGVHTKSSQVTSYSSSSPRVNGKLRLRPNPFLREWEAWTQIPAVSHFSWGSLYTHLGVIDLSCAQALQDSVNRRLSQKFYSVAGSIAANLADAYRTRRETVDMVTSKLMTITKAARAVRRGRFNRAASILGLKCPPKRVAKKRPFSRNWLEYSYGWAPLVGDIATLVNQPFPEVVVPISISVKDTDGGNFVYKGDGELYDYRYSWFATCSSRLTANMFLKDSGLAAANRLGLTNPAALAWEATPWSLVVDWVLPINNWLESLSALSGVDLRDLSVTTNTRLDFDISSSQSIWNYSSNVDNGSSFGSLHRKSRSLLVPEIYFPRPKNPFSGSHLLNAIALYRTSVK